MEETFEKWVSLGQDSKAIAAALYQASEGKVTKLNDRDWNNEDGVWERALRILFPDSVFSSTDRYFLWAIWIQERKGVAENYQNLRGKPFQRSQKSQPDVGNTSHCFCQRSYKLLKNVPMIQCGSCSAWYHGLCAFVNPLEFKGNKPFRCAVCEGKVQTPPIFLETPRSSPADSHRSTPQSSGRGRGVPQKSQTQPDVIVSLSDTNTPFRNSQREGQRSAVLARERALKLPSKLCFDDRAVESEDGISRQKLVYSEGHKGSLKQDLNVVPRDPDEVVKLNLDKIKGCLDGVAVNPNEKNQALFDDDCNKEGDRKNELGSSSDEESWEVIDEVVNSHLLDEEITEESRKQDEDAVKIPMSKRFTSTMSLNISENDDKFDIKNPVSPKKKDGLPHNDDEDDEKSSCDDEEEQSNRLSDEEEKNEQDDMNKQSEDDENETIDTSGIPSIFEANLKYEEWRSFIRTKDDDKKVADILKKQGKKVPTYTYIKNYRIDTEYTNVFSKIFDRFNR